jgi:hypothetical protein
VPNPVSFMFLLVISAIAGGMITAVTALPYSAVLALCLAPVGGSIVAAIASAWLAYGKKAPASLTDPATDDLVSSLRVIGSMATGAHTSNPSKRSARSSVPLLRSAGDRQ